MKNLIEEIEGHKFSYAYDDFRKGYNGGLNVAIEVLNQYNIITAPKSIKLSEIVSRLKDCKVERYSDYISLYDTYTDTLPFDIETEMKDYLLLIKGNKIEKVHCIDKWLYTLWIAGTEIIDDMKESE